MAGDWIKMRGNLWDDPRITRLCDLTEQSEATVIGALYWLWATADQHSQDGGLPGLTTRGIDRKTGVPEFAAALVAIGWLADGADGVRIVNFTDHNGASAKRRITEATRKANVRKLSASDADIDRTEPGQIAPKFGAREDKRLEKEKDLAPQASPAADLTLKADSKRATRLPVDWALTPELNEIGRRARLDADLPPVNLALEAAKFADFWRSKSGKDAAKTDWTATWRNWCRNARGPSGNVLPKAAEPVSRTAEEMGL